MTTNRIIYSILLFLLFFVAGVFIMFYLQTSLQGTTMILGVDIYPRWVGTQAILHGESPYAQETRQKIWLAIYGSANTPHGNLFGFYYPPAITTLYLPIVLLGISVNLAAVLWCAFLWAVVPTALLFWVINFRQLQNRLFLLPALLISGWFFRPAFSNYLLGQFALFSVLSAIAAWLAFKNDRPICAGIFGALSLLKPTLTLIPLMLLFIERRRNQKGILAFAASSLIMYMPPTIMIGWWIPDFLADITKYAQENSVSWSIADMGTVSGLLWLLTSLGLIEIGIYTKNSLLTFGSATALNAIFIPHTADYDLVAFIPLFIYLGDQWFIKENGRIFSKVLFFILLWIPWLTLIVIMLLNIGNNAVETWYRFIWLTYPSIILIVSLITQKPILQSIVHSLYHRVQH